MTASTTSQLEMTPAEFRRLGYQAVDMIADELARLQNRSTPARQAVPDALREQLLNQPLPEQGESPDALLDFISENVLPYPLGHNHPRFFAWVNSPAAPISILGELLAAGMNSSAAGGDQASTYMEHAVLDWLKTIMGFPRESGALLVSGGSMATTVGLAVMRFVKSQNVEPNDTVRGLGMRQENAPMIVYASTEGHSCITKAVELLGLGHHQLRKIPVDADFRMDTDQLLAQIQADRAAGLRPVCVAASAGTVNTGAIDPLNEIADICQAEDLWFHIDGAFGGVGILAHQAEAHFAGIERADSLGIDPHKWMYIPVECGCAIVHEKEAMRDAFSLVPSYLRDDRLLPWFAEYGPQQTRQFRVLKLWLAMKQIGVDGYRELITRDIELARTLRAKIQANPDFELVATGPLTVTCFRYAPAHIQTPSEIEQLNRDLLAMVQSQGNVYLTSTELQGNYVLRANIVNFRTTEDDLDVLLDALAVAGQKVLARA